jgi:hypothetical protein
MALTATVVMSAAESASANSTTIGEPPSVWPASSDANFCLAPCLAVEIGRTGPGNSELPSLTSPVDGLVTAWSIRSTDNVTYALRILRPIGHLAYTGAGTSTGVDPGTGSGELTFPTSLPIKQGDAIGIAAVAGDSDVGVPLSNGGLDEWASNALGEPADGASAAFTVNPSNGRLLLDATVSYCAVPDVGKLKRVAAQRALAAADCGAKVRKKKTKRRKLRGRVLKQSPAAGTTAVPGTVDVLLVGRK